MESRFWTKVGIGATNGDYVDSPKEISLRCILLGLHGGPGETEADSASSFQTLTPKVYILVVVLLVEATLADRQYREREAQFFAHIVFQA